MDFEAVGAAPELSLTSSIPIVVATISAAIALIGLVAAYVSNRSFANRNRRTDRVERQLKELYGPLLAHASSSNRAWAYFRSEYRPNGQVWGQNPPPTEIEAEAWRTWMLAVFMPTNRAIRNIIVDKADLLVDDDMPECLLQVCAQVAAYEAILLAWNRGDYSENKTSLQFPGQELLEYARANFTELKRAQERLTGGRS